MLPRIEREENRHEKREAATPSGKQVPPTLMQKRAKNGGTDLGAVPPPVPEAKIPKK
jgi:hypothetical protein